MSGLPMGWTETVLGEVGEWRGGGTPNKATARFWMNGTIPWVSPKDMKRPIIDDTEDHITSEAIENSSTQLVPSGSVLIVTRSGILKHSLPVAMTTREVGINQDLKAITPYGDCDPIFLAAELRAKSKEILLHCAKAGTTVDNLDSVRLKNFSVSLPPLTEQHRIVAKLDSLTGRTARAREELERIPRLIQKYREAILSAAFSGELTRGWKDAQSALEPVDQLLARIPEPSQSRGGREATTNVKPGVVALSINKPGWEVPNGWSWVSLRRIARQETGHTPSRSHPEYWGGNIPWIGIRDAGDHHGKIIRNTLQTVTEDGLANSSARLLPEGTVCLSRTASVGYVTIMGRSMATSQDFATWTCSAALVPKYLMFAILAEGDNIRSFGEGSTHTTIYFPEIRALHICLAPVAEQLEIVRLIETAFAWLDRVAAEHANASRLLPRLDQAILVKAFRGGLVPQDKNDEQVPLAAALATEGQGRRSPDEAKRGRARINCRGPQSR